MVRAVIVLNLVVIQPLTNIGPDGGNTALIISDILIPIFPSAGGAWLFALHQPDHSMDCYTPKERCGSAPETCMFYAQQFGWPSSHRV